jgi:hypothetical protein
MWFHRKGFSEKAAPKKDDEYTEEELQLDPEEYDCYLNPQLVAETEVKI